MSKLSDLTNGELHNRKEWLQTELAKELLENDAPHHKDVEADFRPFFDEVELEMKNRQTSDEI